MPKIVRTICNTVELVVCVVAACGVDLARVSHAG
jgi:hypothetical protein